MFHSLTTNVEEDSMELLIYLVIGVIAGWLAGQLSEGHGFGTAGNLIVGVIGAIVGGLMLNVLGVQKDYGFWGSVATSTIGAMVFLFLVGMFTGRRPSGRVP
jgi:uncharacterized membrane protein YeaQ/YmgE (transglycosylase-associated protein family)